MTKLTNLQNKLFIELFYAFFNIFKSQTLNSSQHFLNDFPYFSNFIVKNDIRIVQLMLSYILFVLIDGNQEQIYGVLKTRQSFLKPLKTLQNGPKSKKWNYKSYENVKIQKKVINLFICVFNEQILIQYEIEFNG